jgi:hypothetical protein
VPCDDENDDDDDDDDDDDGVVIEWLLDPCPIVRYLFVLCGMGLDLCQINVLVCRVWHANIEKAVCMDKLKRCLSCVCPRILIVFYLFTHSREARDDTHIP